MRTLLLLACMALAGCGYNEAYNRRQLSELSDVQLMQAHAAATSPMTSLAVPKQKEWTLEEMKRRGLVGPGKDGKPTESNQ